LTTLTSCPTARKLQLDELSGLRSAHVQMWGKNKAKGEELGCS
jgi:hypothetical protein